MNKNISAVYAGSFDPVTLGHENIIKRAAEMFGTLHVAIGINSTKKPLLDLETRVKLLSELTKGFENVRVMTFSGLLVDFCSKENVTVSVRGLRAVSDYEYEMAIAHVNADQEPHVETIFLPTLPHLSFVSSSIVKDLARLGGDVTRYVSPSVLDALKRALLDKT